MGGDGCLWTMIAFDNRRAADLGCADGPLGLHAKLGG